MDSNELLLAPFERLLKDMSPPDRVREIEAGGEGTALWEAVAQSGFLDALVSEESGGAGLPLAAAEPLLQALGRHVVPLPVGETMVARAILAAAGAPIPDGAIVLAVASDGATPQLPLAQTADHVLVQWGERLHLVAVTETSMEYGPQHGLSGALSFAREPAGPEAPAPKAGLRALAATVRAAAIAGACDRVLEMSVAYANERVQFGKPIGRQQAVQQQLAVMAEQVVAARIAAQLGCSLGLEVTIEAAAVAKHAASLAAVEVARIAHAVFGAIGISEECDLQLYTRRLLEWRMADGSEAYWATVLGERRLAAPAASSIDYLPAHVR